MPAPSEEATIHPLRVLPAILLLSALTMPAAQAEEPASPDYCRTVYAPQMTMLWAKAQARRCRGFAHRENSRELHYKWCLMRSEALAERVLAENARTTATCRP